MRPSAETSPAVTGRALPSRIRPTRRRVPFVPAYTAAVPLRLFVTIDERAVGRVHEQRLGVVGAVRDSAA